MEENAKWSNTLKTIWRAGTCMVFCVSVPPFFTFALSWLLPCFHHSTSAHSSILHGVVKWLNSRFSIVHEWCVGWFLLSASCYHRATCSQDHADGFAWFNQLSRICLLLWCIIFSYGSYLVRCCKINLRDIMMIDNKKKSYINYILDTSSSSSCDQKPKWLKWLIWNIPPDLGLISYFPGRHWLQVI